MMRHMLIALSRAQWPARLLTRSRLGWAAARRFVAGEKLEDAVEVVKRLNSAGLSATIDHLGEHTNVPAEAERAAATYCEIASQIRASGLHSGISLKLTALGLKISESLAEEQLRKVVAHAAGLTPPVFVRIDMEDSSCVQATLDIFYRLFPTYRNLGVVIQSYLYRSRDDVERLASVGAGVRMVKGAYLEPRTVAYPDKRDVDREFIRLSTRLFAPDARANGTYLALATHDTAIIDWAKRYTTQEGIAGHEFEFQFLYGIRRDLQTRLVEEGYRMRVYVPYGTQWYPYFMRRLAERPQNVAFLLRNVAREFVSSSRSRS